MFMCRFTSGATDSKGAGAVWLEIEDCPSHGLAAIDYREKSGLIAEPTNVIVVPARTWRSEEFCRKSEKWIDEGADLDGLELAGIQSEYFVDSDGAIKTSRPRRMNAVKSSCHWPFANAVYIAAYLADPSDEACAVLWENIWRIGRSNFDRAQAESTAILYAQKEREQKIKDAHEFLKAELAELAELRRQVALLKERIAFLTPVPF